MASFFVRPQDRASERGLLVRESDASVVESPDSPFVVRGQAVLPWTSPVLGAGQATGVLFRLYASDLPESTSFKFLVIQSDSGEELPAPLFLRESLELEDGTLYLASLDLARIQDVDWAPGDYSLKIEWMGDQTRGTKGIVSELPFQIVSQGADPALK